uniref:Uncharacterized protein n=1 Tax=Halimeda micronesica TaxID=170426 RepID=A0A386AXG2_9CHLO|nr:hypothetical protein [Halimeda micronesica]
MGKNYLLNYIDHSIVYKVGVSEKLMNIYQNYLFFAKTQQFPSLKYSVFRPKFMDLLEKMNLCCEIIQKNNTFYITNLQLGSDPTEEELLEVARNIKRAD